VERTDKLQQPTEKGFLKSFAERGKDRSLPGGTAVVGKCTVHLGFSQDKGSLKVQLWDWFDQDWAKDSRVGEIQLGIQEMTSLQREFVPLAVRHSMGCRTCHNFRDDLRSSRGTKKMETKRSKD
jgi:hypothetical protein